MTRFHSFLSGVALLSTTAFAWDAVLNLSDEKQTIRGFGGMTHPVWISDRTQAQRDTAFGNGDDPIDMTLLRIHVDESSDNWATAT